MTKTEGLVALAHRMITDAATRESHARQAWNLAHRARRVLELAAETASRDRWTQLDAPAPGTKGRDKEETFAAACMAACTKYPVSGEPAVYAALLNGVDQAIEVSESLYLAWLDTQERGAPAHLTGERKIGGAPAPGAHRRMPLKEAE
jgi:hypothetical protein